MSCHLCHTLLSLSILRRTPAALFGSLLTHPNKCLCQYVHFLCLGLNLCLVKLAVSEIFWYIMMAQVNKLVHFGAVERGHHFMVALLSHHNELGPILVTFVSTIVRFMSHPCCSASYSYRYSASDVDSSVHFCFRDSHATGLVF